jgi:glutamine amidotransferase
MCELFGLSCNAKDRATLSLRLFSRYSEENCHGWGIGYYVGNRARVVKRAEKAKLSEEFWQEVARAKNNIILAHLRFASVGERCDKNCHPFRFRYLGRDWLFAHNGTLYIDYPSRLESDIDSARAFTFLMDKVEEYRRKGEMRGLYPAIREATRELLARYEGTLNYLLSDGHLLYAFCNHRQMYLLRREKDYGGAILLCTQELTDENWIEVPKNRILAVSGGEILVLSDRL